MLKKQKELYKFIIYFLFISALLTVFWKIISILYIHLLVIIAKPIWSIFGYPVQLVIKENILSFVYIKIAQEPMSFDVHNVDEIYLNLVLLGAFFGATWFTISKKIIPQTIFSFGILFFIHEVVLYIYSYTNIWEYIVNEEYKIQKTLIPSISQFFSVSAADILNHVLFHWNAWGWDVIPFVLWLVSIYKFILPKKQKNLSRAT